MSLGSNLKYLRELLNLQQNYVADELGINNSTYNRYENDERFPKYDKLEQLAKFYRVSIQALLIDYHDKIEGENLKLGTLGGMFEFYQRELASNILVIKDIETSDRDGKIVSEIQRIYDDLLIMKQSILTEFENNLSHLEPYIVQKHKD